MCALQLRQFLPEVVLETKTSADATHFHHQIDNEERVTSFSRWDRPLDPREQSQSQRSTACPALPARNAPPASSQAWSLELGCGGSFPGPPRAPRSTGARKCGLLQPGPSSSRGAAAPGRMRSHSAAAPSQASQARMARVCRVEILCCCSAACALCLVAEPSRDPTRPRSVPVQSRHLTSSLASDQAATPPSRLPVPSPVIRPLPGLPTPFFGELLIAPLRFAAYKR